MQCAEESVFAILEYDNVQGSLISQIEHAEFKSCIRNCNIRVHIYILLVLTLDSDELYRSRKGRSVNYTRCCIEWSFELGRKGGRDGLIGSKSDYSLATVQNGRLCHIAGVLRAAAF